MSKEQKTNLSRRVESFIHNVNTRIFCTIAILGLISAGCSQRYWATEAPRQVDVVVTIEDDLGVNINPELKTNNTALRVQAEDGSYVHLSDNPDEIPGTIFSVDIKPSDLTSQTYTSILYVKDEGFTRELECHWVEGVKAILAPGEFVATLNCVEQ